MRLKAKKVLLREQGALYVEVDVVQKGNTALEKVDKKCTSIVLVYAYCLVVIYIQRKRQRVCCKTYLPAVFYIFFQTRWWCI